MVEPRYSSISLVRSGLSGKCPRCGHGQLFSGYLSVSERCDVCGLDFQSQDAGDGPAVFIILILGFIIVGAAALFEIFAGPPLWLHLLLWTPVTLGGSVLLLRPFKAFMIALHYKHGLLAPDQNDKIL
ncbi:uncharacterized protein METZ01_LOCUS404146 [marine metagenome]|uniref:DUF983 domain-containing protein n=1 Tax=marine metagenome TaxID=408172 RepID=A0A382VXN3_9ZZZZ